MSVPLKPSVTLKYIPSAGAPYIRKGNGERYAVIPYFALNIPDTGARALFIKAVQCVFTRRSGKGVALPALKGRGAAADIQVHEIRGCAVLKGVFALYEELHADFCRLPPLRFLFCCGGRAAHSAGFDQRPPRSGQAPKRRRRTRRSPPMRPGRGKGQRFKRGLWHIPFIPLKRRMLSHS